MEKWKDPNLSLGERCVAFSENEMKSGVCEDKPNSYTSPRIREYLAICTRLVNGKETKLGLAAGNWCACSGSFAMKESLLPGEVPPHGYRVGVVEVVADMQHNGTYISINDVRSGKSKIKVGDIIIFDRSTPGKPETNWFRHFGRIYSIDSADTFKCISGNSGGRWKISSHKLSQPTLLGFGSYPDKQPSIIVNNGPRPPLSFDNVNILDLAPLEDTGKFISQGFFDKFKNIFGSK